MDYNRIKSAAKEVGVRVTDLIALAPANDPFYAGTPNDWTQARWFADLWDRFGYGQGVHIRRVHYQIISQDPPILQPNGTPYENTEECWKFLTQASKMARYLRLVDPSAFVDRRNPEPRIYNDGWHEEPFIAVYGDNTDIGIRLPDFPALPTYSIEGFCPEQHYHLEVWCEKSTMNDVLIPLCQEYSANLVTGVGEMSITSVLSLLNRLDPAKPARICYVSDFDPAGQSMPVAVSRKIESELNTLGDSYDIRLRPIVLTVEQIQTYSLPRTPIKASERRRQSFEDRHGSGAVELDALEALHPGALGGIILAWLDEYYDHALADRVAQAENALRDDLREIVIDATGQRSREIDELRIEYAAAVEEFEGRVSGLSQRIEELWHAIGAELEERQPDIDDYPIPQATRAAENGGDLFSSDREYFEQLISYKAFQGKEIAFQIAA